MADNPIILNNSGDDQYKFLARDWASNPIKCSYLKIFLADSSQYTNVLTIYSKTSTGAKDIRKLSISRYVDASNKSGLIALIPLTPELILDGSTYFTFNIPALSQVIMMFYYDQNKKL